MAGMDGLLATVLAPREGEAAIAVLTDTDPESFLERMDDPEGPVAIVDCTGEERDFDGIDDRFVRRVSSLTTLSVYVERKQLFAFLNALEPRVTGHDGLFVAALYAESVAAQTQSTVEPLFDGRIEPAWTDSTSPSKPSRRRRSPMASRCSTETGSSSSRNRSGPCCRHCRSTNYRRPNPSYRPSSTTSTAR
jgi:hypothetical protein